MGNSSRLLWLFTGLILGVAGAGLYLRPGTANAGSNDRFEDYVMCTGSVGVTARAPTDGVWLLDYRTGKLLATVIDRTSGKILGWANAGPCNHVAAEEARARFSRVRRARPGQRARAATPAVPRVLSDRSRAVRPAR